MSIESFKFHHNFIFTTKNIFIQILHESHLPIVNDILIPEKSKLF